MEKKTILIVDDDPIIRDALEKAFRGRRDLTVELSADPEQAFEMAKATLYDIVITDMKMPRMSGVELLRRLKSVSPATTVVVMTAYATVETAVEAMKEGAFDYLTKPFSIDELEVVVSKALEHRKLVDENTYLRDEISANFNFGMIVGESCRMKQLYELVAKVSQSSASVFIQGESGTGKEMVARAIHYGGARAKGPFIKVNCAALSSSLLESELFGHEKGAFTNAIYRKLGRFELADKGTLLLDEISEMEPALQAKLLRVLQEKEFDRVGGSVPIKTDVRIISTTNRQIGGEIRAGRFREDLYYRLNVVPVVLPPLRERREDIPLLISHFIAKYNHKNGKKVRGCDDRAMKMLMAYGWPGNVRELENCVERAIVLTGSDQLSPEHFLFDAQWQPVAPSGPLSTAPAGAESLNAGGLIEPLSVMEKKAILRALEACGMNKTKAALLLGVTARTLRNKLKEFDLEDEESFSGAAQ